MFIVWLDTTIDRLIAQERNIRTLIEAAPNGILLIDGYGHITLVNAGTEVLFGYKREELLCKGVEVLVPDRYAKAHSVLREAFQKNPEVRAMGAGAGSQRQAQGWKRVSRRDRA
jgi:PAS domain S-box-containing protein